MARSARELLGGQHRLAEVEFDDRVARPDPGSRTPQHPQDARVDRARQDQLDFGNHRARRRDGRIERTDIDDGSAHGRELDRRTDQSGQPEKCSACNGHDGHAGEHPPGPALPSKLFVKWLIQTGLPARPSGARIVPRRLADLWRLAVIRRESRGGRVRSWLVSVRKRTAQLSAGACGWRHFSLRPRRAIAQRALRASRSLSSQNAP